LFKEEFMLPVGAIERKTDRNYRGDVIGDLIRRSQNEMMSPQAVLGIKLLSGVFHKFFSQWTDQY
jgi:hypothetical protein